MARLCLGLAGESATALTTRPYELLARSRLSLRPRLALGLCSHAFAGAVEHSFGAVLVVLAINPSACLYNTAAGRSASGAGVIWFIAGRLGSVGQPLGATNLSLRWRSPQSARSNPLAQ